MSKVLAEYSIPLGGAEATIVFRGERLSPGDFEALADYITLFKKQFERRQNRDFPKAAIWNQQGVGQRPILIHGKGPSNESGETFCTSNGMVISASELRFET